MQEFFIAILLIFAPDGRTSMEALPVPTYSDCRKLTSAAEAVAKANMPGAEVRSACVSSETIGQKGV
jgi:hypothetical protein